MSGGPVLNADRIVLGGVEGARLLTATVTLTDAQIKALPTTPVTVVAAPASGFWVRIFSVTFSANTAAGAYTNINAAYADFSIKAGTDTLAYGPVNDSAAPALTLITDLLGTASRKVFNHPVASLAAPGAGAGILQYVQNPVVNDYATVQGVAAALSMDNNGSGVLTGGNAANTMRVTVYYSVEAL